METNYTRAELFEHVATMNQLRNTVYHVIRLMQRTSRDMVVDRLRAMGRRIAETFVETWTPKPQEPARLLRVLYATALGSKRVKIDVGGPGGLVRVVDKKCAMCKYPVEDVDAAGCEITAGFVARVVQLMKESGRLDWSLEVVGVDKSKTRGDQTCDHLYRIRGGD
ncbi:MAG: hypothetical protein Kow0069_10800 [Promethearchaeota archaeon]